MKQLQKILTKYFKRSKFHCIQTVHSSAYLFTYFETKFFARCHQSCKRARQVGRTKLSNMILITIGANAVKRRRSLARQSWHHYQHHHHEWKITNQDSQQSPIFFLQTLPHSTTQITILLHHRCNVAYCKEQRL